MLKTSYSSSASLSTASGWTAESIQLRGRGGERKRKRERGRERERKREREREIEVENEEVEKQEARTAEPTLCKSEWHQLKQQSPPQDPVREMWRGTPATLTTVTVD